MRRRQVGLVVASRRSPAIIAARREVDDRDLGRHARAWSTSSSSTAAPADSWIAASMPATTSRSTRHDVAVVLDEAQLDVERDVLGQVAGGVVRLGPEHRPDLVDALEDADHHLLVELRALGQVRRAAEVVEREDVGAALGRRADDLRGVDLDEAARVERRTEPGDRGRADAEGGGGCGWRSATGAWSSRVGRLAREVGPVEVERRRLGGARPAPRSPASVDLDAARRGGSAVTVPRP